MTNLSVTHNQTETSFPGAMANLAPDSPPPVGRAPTALDGQAIDWVFDLIQRIRQSLDLDVVLQTTVSEVRQLLQLERVFLFEFQADWGGGVIVEDCHSDGLSLQGRQICDKYFADKWISAYRQGKIQAVGDIYQAGLPPDHIELLEKLGVRANLVIPLQVKGQLWGLLVAQHCTTPRPWQADEVRMMQQLATQVGTAIEQSERHQEVLAELAIHRQTEDRLQQQAKQFHDRRMESIGTLAGGIAQDLSNVLIPIILAAEMLKQPTLSFKQRQQWLNRITLSAHRGVSLVDQVLAFAQETTGQVGQLQLAYLLGELVQTLQESQPTALRITSQLRQPYLWPVQGDATQLHQVFWNLCLNACEAMPQGGQLHVVAQNCWWRGSAEYPHRLPGAYVRVTVSDTGTGMTPEVCDRSCEPFFTTRAQRGHTGLGLSTARGLIQGHGGWLTLQSRPNQGTVIEVYLPAHLSHITRPQTPLELPESQEAPVLVGLPEGEMRSLLQAILESYHYQVLLAEDSTDAIALYIQHQANLKAVVLAPILPTLNGLSLLRRMHQISPQVPLLAVGDPAAIDPVPTAVQLTSASITPLLNTLAKVLQPSV